jgi:cyclic beta-1,2-glucan synthetase
MKEDTSWDSILAKDPSGIYSQMTSQSRLLYREAVRQLSSKYGISPTDICDAAVTLSSNEPVDPDIRFRLRSHVGYFLFERDGIRRILCHLNRVADRKTLFSTAILHFYISGYVILLSLLIVGYWLSSRSNDAVVLKLVGCLAVAVLGGGAIAVLLNGILRIAVSPRTLPCMDLRTGIREECRTIVVVPSLLLNCSHVRRLMELLKSHARAIPDNNVFILLLTDFVDCQTKHGSVGQLPLLELCCCQIDALNEDAEFRDRKPFFLLHRDLRYSNTQRAWIGWERKRGKLEDLMLFVKRGDNHFLQSIGDIGRLQSAEYIVVLDDDTKLTPNAVYRLIGTHTHPLNHPYLDESNSILHRGYCILDACAISVDRSKVSASRLARAAIARNMGASCLARAAIGRNVGFDAFGRCLFGGKGCIHISTFLAVVAKRIPHELVLSHDVVESGIARTGMASKATVIDEFPVHYNAYMAREHRWTRGDWQNLPWLLPVGMCRGRMSLFGKFAITQCLRNTLVPISIFVLMLLGTRTVTDWLWLIVLTVGASFMVSSVEIFSRGVSGRDRGRMLLWEMTRVVKRLLWLIVTSAHRAVVAADAILRTLWRLMTSRRLLEWSPSALVGGLGSSSRLCNTYRTMTTGTALLFALGLCAKTNRISTVSVVFGLWSCCCFVRTGGPGTRNQASN